MNVPEGDIVFATLASLPTTGNTLTFSGDGDAVLRLEISPGTVAELTAVLTSLRLRTFYVVLLAKPKVVRDASGTQQDAAENKPNRKPRRAEGTRRRRRNGGAARKPDRRTH